MKNNTRFKFAYVRKYSYLIMPIIAGILYGAVMIINSKYYWFELPYDVGSIIFSAQCTFIGFFITIWLLVFALPKDNSNAQGFQKQHLPIFSRINCFGIAFSVLSVISHLFGAPNYIIVLFFILSVSELVCAAYYVYHMIRMFFLN